jgi:hypothetical protein
MNMSFSQNLHWIYQQNNNLASPLIYFPLILIGNENYGEYY